jgi:hypothetical protein
MFDHRLIAFVNLAESVRVEEDPREVTPRRFNLLKLKA